MGRKDWEFNMYLILFIIPIAFTNGLRAKNLLGEPDFTYLSFSCISILEYSDVRE